jgi:ubiquitin-activating enzyme E1 C
MDVDQNDNNNAASNPDLAAEQHERDEQERWRDLDALLTRPSNLAGPGFEPGPELRQFLASDACRILVVGAGGLGCELLKDLALTGFRHLDVVDMDTIDVSNLNRQFLFRTQDVGQPKAVVAARKVEARVEGCSVTAHHARIEDLPASFYAGFTAIVLGLDSLEARRYMNGVVCGMLGFEDAAAAPEEEEEEEEEEEGGTAGAADTDAPPGAKRRRSSPAAAAHPRRDPPPPTVDLATVKPVIDGGTEGFKGHARVILPGLTPCFECTLWLFPPQVRFPLCTLAETPRTPAHCVEYAHLIRWGQDRPGEEFDADDEEHMAWVFRVASERAAAHGIAGVTLPLAQGVVKGIVPAVASTNAIVSAACVLETLKAITMCSQGLNNYMM